MTPRDVARTNAEVRVWFGHPQALSLVPDDLTGVAFGLWDGLSFPPPQGSEGVEFYVAPFELIPYAQVFDSLSNLRVVQLSTSGYNHVLPHIREGMTLCNAGGVHDDSVAEWVMTAILGVLRDIPAYARLQQRRVVQRFEARELRGSTVLLIGWGQIGMAVERRLAPFGVSILRVASSARAGVHGPGSLADLLPQAQVVVIVAPLTPQTRGMVNSGFLSRMPDGALLVNASRGEIVVQEDLLAELRTGRIGAAIDAATPDPLPDGHPLLAEPGLLYTPHVGGHTVHTLSRLYDLVGSQLRSYLRGAPLRHVVSLGGKATPRQP